MRTRYMFLRFTSGVTPADICLFVGPLISRLWTSVTPLGFKPQWATLFTLGGGGTHDALSMRFTSGVTPADLLAASMAAIIFPYG